MGTHQNILIALVINCDEKIKILHSIEGQCIFMEHPIYVEKNIILVANEYFISKVNGLRVNQVLEKKISNGKYLYHISNNGDIKPLLEDV